MRTDPLPAGPSWRQVSIQFFDYAAAERTGVTHIGPGMAAADEAGLVASWFFIRKAPCWRLRFLPSHGSTDQDAASFIHQRLDALHDAGRIAGWVEGIYEPELHAFGGADAMDVAHRLFHHDSRHILAYLGSDAGAAGSGSDQRRELSILLCSILMRGAGQDWYEQGDVWARVAEHRALPPGAPVDGLRRLESGLRRLMTVDAAPTTELRKEGGSLACVSAWVAAFEEAGGTLGNLARDGTLRRGMRAILAHHVIFHWNRIGLSHDTQGFLANAATMVVLGE